MGQALFWGAVAGGANLLGALIVMAVALPQKLIGYIMALGTGALIGAVAFELLVEAMEISGLMYIALGFLGGALIFTFLDILVTRKGGMHRKRSGHGKDAPSNSEASAGMAIFLGTIMDAIPETAMIGLGLAQGGGIGFALIAAVFISNLPEGISSTTGLQKGGFHKKKVLFMWVFVVVVSALSSLIGYTFLENAPTDIQALISAFAAGGIIAMVASTMMPEAHEKGGPITGFITALGIFITLMLQQI
ncbi:ZIP family metal transporter [Planococcus sp. 1R117A]|uniref:ZIP family metal transporter n=1 Tax=Planococcus sp. 1R117A TaxID=3447020 RepID=UPI003EDBACDD